MKRSHAAKWSRRVSVGLLGMALVAGVTGAGTAVGQSDSLAVGVAPHGGLPVDALRGTLSPRLASASGKVTAFVQLAKPSAVDAFTAETDKGTSKDEAKRAASQVKGELTKTIDAVVGTLRSLDSTTRVLYRTVNAIAGVVVTADAAKVRELAALPEVASVLPMVPKEPTNSGAVQLTKTVNAWQQTGKLGDDVRIGIIDDGVDYTHADFGGPGTTKAYDAIDRTKVSPAYFPTAKVIGGTDLAGDDYDGAGVKGSNIPKPDPNPLACGQHGTHVAGTAAGFGVNSDGSTFRGDYSKLTPESLNDMRIGPGTAPKALLYAIKVFGCAGSTNLTVQAMDLALDPNGDGDFGDHLDVVNLSLGSDFGAPDDPDSLFVKKLNKAGVLTVIAGGNGGDLYDAGGSPGTTPEALTVASVRDPYVVRDGIEAAAPGDVAGSVAGQYSQDYAGYDTLDLTEPVVTPAVQSNVDGCRTFSDADRARIAGKFVWLEWDDNDATRACGSTVRVNNAQAAGAAGVLLSSTLDNFNAAIAGNAAVPEFQLTRSATDRLRPALRAGTLKVRLAGKLRTSVPTVTPELADTPSSFTARGVRSPSVKPDVAAPGDTIASALRGSGDQTLVLSGTSMAAPHAAGVAALVRQAHPDWSPGEVKAAMVNTADADIHTETGGLVLAPERVGAGRIDANAALNNQVLATVPDDPGGVSVSFGTVEATGPVSLSKTVKLVNKSTQRVEFGVEYQAVTETPGVRYELSTDSVSLAPRGSATVVVTLRIADPSALRKTMDPTVAPTQNNLARQFVADASGRIAFTPRAGSTVPLRVPVYSAPKPASDISMPSRVRFTGQDTTAALSLRGKGIDQGSGSQAYRSLVSVFELQASSPRLPACRGDVVSACAVNGTARGGDLRYVGVTSTAPTARQQGRPADALLAFGIATWGNWYNLGSNTVPFVDIDTTGDGAPDFKSFVTKLAGTDVWVVNTVDLHRAGFPSVDLQPVNGQLGDVDTNVFDTNVVVLPISLTALGIDPAAPSARISYTVGVAGYYVAPGDPTGLIDHIDTPMSFDPLNPGLYATGTDGSALSYQAMSGTSLVVNRNVEALAGDRADGLLALWPHNPTGKRASVIGVDFAGGSAGRP